MNVAKVVVLLLCLMASGLCQGRDPPARQVRVFFTEHHVAGDIVPANRLLTILFMKEPCPLPVAGRDNMLRAWMYQGSYQLGCWYPTINDKFVTIDGEGSMNIGIYWEALPRALLLPDGSAKITEPEYNSETFLALVSNQKLREWMARGRDQRP